MNYNLLLVDDSPDSRALQKIILKKIHPFNISEANDPIEGLSILEELYSKNSLPHMILTAHHMPKMSGTDFCHKLDIDSRFKNIPVIMITASEEDSILKEAFDAGIHDFIRKPIKQVEFSSRIKSAIRLIAEQIKTLEKEQELIILQNKLLEKNNSLEKNISKNISDLEIAHKIQLSMLPDKKEQINNIKYDYFFLSCPQIGGDLFNVFSPEPDITAFYILDVSANGLFSSLNCIILNQLLSNYYDSGSLIRDNYGNLRNPSEVLSLLNMRTCLNPDFQSYFSFVYGIINHKKNTISFSSAGHNPFFTTNNKTKKVLCHTQVSGPLGWELHNTFPQIEISFDNNTRIFLYSDGLINILKEEENEDFGLVRLQCIIEETAHLEFKEIIPFFDKKLSQWNQYRSTTDDISMFVMELLN